jgi:2-polyprenyl-3-methyl-5-hydroxy-6-metoxy-1,4-benzoquinol methylase
LLARWAARDGLRLEVTGIDPDPRAVAHATAQPATPGVTFRQVLSSDLVAEGATFDVVVSNHVLHHLGAEQLNGLLRDSEALARRRVIHNDIARSRLAYAGYWVGTLPLHRRGRPHAPFVRDDGLLSIRRSYRPDELAAVLPPGWGVATLPFRVLAVRDVPDVPGGARTVGDRIAGAGADRA